MRLVQIVSTVLMAGLTSVCLWGCSQSEVPKAPAGQAAAGAHDPDDVPITEADVKMPANYAEAVDRIRSYRDVIQAAVEGGTPTKAHRALDELDIVLNKLPSIARDSGVPKQKWETVNTTARELRDLFNEVHTAIDEQRTPDFAAVAKPINQAIDRLAEVKASETK
jgi:hypothetical protein